MITILKQLVFNKIYTVISTLSNFKSSVYKTVILRRKALWKRTLLLGRLLKMSLNEQKILILPAKKDIGILH